MLLSFLVTDEETGAERDYKICPRSPDQEVEEQEPQRGREVQVMVWVTVLITQGREQKEGTSPSTAHVSSAAHMCWIINTCWMNECRK